MSAPVERLKILDAIDTDIINCLQNAGQVFAELSKEKPSIKQAENHTHSFLKSLGSVESKLNDQINYLTQVSTGQPHEGSGYAAQKVLQMAWHRLEHVRSRITELDRIKNKHLQDRASMVKQQPQPTQQPQPSQMPQLPQPIKTEPFK